MRRLRHCLLGGLLGDLRKGQIGHTTQLTLFTLEGILRAITRANLKGLCYPPAIIFHAYRRWYRTRIHPLVPDDLGELDGWLVFEPAMHTPVVAGDTTWASIRNGRVWELKPPSNRSWGSDAVARCAPAAFMDDGNFQLGVDIAGLTHGHPEAKHAAGAFAVILRHLLAGARLEVAVQHTVQELIQAQDRDLAERVQRAYAWGRELPDAALVHAAYPVPQRAGDALCLALLATAAATDGRAQHGLPPLALPSTDPYTPSSRPVRSMRGQLLACCTPHLTLPETHTVRELDRIITRLARDMETHFEDTQAWWEAYPGW